MSSRRAKAVRADLPVTLGGLWGFKLYGTLDDVAFRKLILLLLLVSGLPLIAAQKIGGTALVDER